MLERVRGQTAEMGAEVRGEVVTGRDGSLTGRLARADAAHAAHEADVVAWIDRRRATLYLALYPSRRVFAREVLLGSAGDPIGSAELEVIGIMVRTALQASVDQVPLGMERARFLAQASPRAAPHVRPGRRRVLGHAGVGWQTRFADRKLELDHGPVVVVGLGVGLVSVDLFASATAGRALRTETTSFSLATYAVGVLAAVEPVSLGPVHFGLSVGGGYTWLRRDETVTTGRASTTGPETVGTAALTALVTARWSLSPSVSLIGGVGVLLLARKPVFLVMQAGDVVERASLWRTQPSASLALRIEI